MNDKLRFLYDALVGVCVAVLAFAVFVSLARPRSSVDYTEYTYPTSKPVYIPGEQVVFVASLEVQQEGRFDVRRGWRQRLPEPPPTLWFQVKDWLLPDWLFGDQQMPIAEPLARLCDGTPAKIADEPRPAYTRTAVGSETEGQVAVAVPELRPGDYWITNSAVNGTGGESVTRVAVRIERPCPGA
jgi:hypothetical protein